MPEGPKITSLCLQFLTFFSFSSLIRTLLVFSGLLKVNGVIFAKQGPWCAWLGASGGRWSLGLTWPSPAHTHTRIGSNTHAGKRPRICLPWHAYASNQIDTYFYQNRLYNKKKIRTDSVSIINGGLWAFWHSVIHVRIYAHRDRHM